MATNSEDDQKLYITLRDVYDEVRGLGQRMDQKFDSVDAWQTTHEAHDAVMHATMLGAIDAANTRMGVQEANVAVALAAVNAAREKAEAAVDKRFEKVDRIGQMQDRMESSGAGRLAGSQSTQSLIFAIVGTLGVLSSIAFALTR